MRLGGILLFLMPIFAFNTLSAQHPCEDIGVTDTLGFITDINIPDDGILDPGDDFCIDFSVENFDLVIGFQFTLSFDPSVMEYTFNTMTPGVLVGPLSINDIQAENGALSVLWINFNAEGQTLPDGTQIFTLCFRAIGEPNDCSDLYFNEFYPFFPELEVSHQAVDGEPCTDNVLLLNGESSVQIKVACDELNIIDVKSCNSTTMTGGSISFSACGGALPYTYEFSDGTIMLTGMITTDGEEVNFGNIPNGVYTITITDSNGEMVVRNINIENGDPLDFDEILRPPSCSNFENGTIVIENINGGIPGINGYTIQGSNGQFIPNTYADSLVRLSNGDYTVTVTDDSGCEVIETYTLLTEEIEATIELDSASCFNANDGAIRIFPSGGVPYPGGEYLFVGKGQMTSFETTSPFEDACFSSLSNTFNVTIQDANLCEIDLEIEIPTKSEIEIEISNLIDVACKGDSTGSITVDVITPGRYLFLLRDASTGEFVTAQGFVVGNNQLNYNGTLPAGSYILNITESDVGCTLDTTFIITEPAEELIVSGGSIQADCNLDNGLAFVEVQGGMTPYSYEWSGNPGINNDTLYNLFAGLYTVTVTDFLGCSKEVMIDLIQGDVFEVEIQLNNDLACDGSGGGEIQAVLIAGNPGTIAINWSSDFNPNLGSGNFFMINQPGEYYMEAISTNPDCMDFDTIFFDPANIVSFDVDLNSPSCGFDDGSIEIINLQGGVGPYTCEWDSPGFTDCIGTGLMAGTYNVTISDNAGCEIDTFFVLSETNSEITFDIDIEHPSCVEAIDGTISFINFMGGNPPYDCMWGDDPMVVGCPRTGLSAGTYPVTITDADGCQKDTVIVLVDPDPITIDVLTSSIVATSCYQGNDGQALVSIIDNPSGATDFNFVWSNPADDDSGGLSDNATQLSPGLNFVYAFDNNSCASDTFFFNVPEPPMIQLDFGSTIISDPDCKGACTGEADLEAIGGTSATGTYRYEWEDGFTGNMRNDLCAGTHFITITDDNNCEHIDSIILIDPDTLFVEVDLNGTVGLNCFGDDSGIIQVRTTGGCGSYSYNWSGSNSTSDLAADLPEGNYSVTVTDACGCTDETSYELTASTPIVAVLAEPELADCFGGTSCIGIESVTGGAGPNYTYSINFGDRIPIDSCVDVIAGMYSISVFDAAGCFESYSLTVDQPDPISVDLGPDIELNLGDSTAILDAEITSINPIDSIMWSSEGAFSCISDNCQSISVLTNSFAVYQVTVTDINGCTGVDEIEVSISANRNVYIPNAFNPTLFPPNDKFMILTGEGVVEVTQFRIFDRWGNLVFLKENLSSPTSIDDGWDGRMDNREVEQGVYVYIAEVRFVDDKVIQYKGDITLIR